MLKLPGVGRKTANLILGDVYGKEGYVCDTHCIRITGLLGITDGSKDPLKVEMQLRKAIPPEESNDFLPPDGPPRPGSVCGPPAGLCQLHPAALVRSLHEAFRLLNALSVLSASPMPWNLLSVPPPFLQEGAHFSSSGHILERQRKGGPGMKQNEPSKLQQLLNDKKAIAALAKSPDAQALAKDALPEQGCLPL